MIDEEQLSERVERLRVLIEGEMTVNNLKTMLRSANLGVTGRKSQLQERLLSYIRNSLGRGNVRAIDELRVIALSESGTGRPRKVTSDMAVGVPSPLHTHDEHQDGYPNGTSNISSSPAPVVFVDSPFYKVRRPISSACIIKRPYRSDKTTVAMNISFNADEVEGMKNGTLGVYILSAKYDVLTQYRKSIVEFPAHLDLQVNFEYLPIVTKASKNRPGAVRPPDITQNVLKRNSTAGAGCTHSINMTISLVKEADDYIINAYIVDLVSMETLLKEVMCRLHITKKSTMDKILRDNDADDDDLVATSSVLSLKDPISWTRISTAAKARSCTHLESFDLETYFMLQQQGPSWLCPLCNKQISYSDIAIDEYMQEVLENTRDSGAEEIEIEPDGSWTVPAAQLKRRDDSASSDDDEELRQTKKRHTELAEQITEIIDLDSDDTEVENNINPVAVPNTSDTTNDSTIVSDALRGLFDEPIEPVPEDNLLRIRGEKTYMGEDGSNYESNGSINEANRSNDEANGSTNNVYQENGPATERSGAQADEQNNETNAPHIEASHQNGSSSAENTPQEPLQFAQSTTSRAPAVASSYLFCEPPSWSQSSLFGGDHLVGLGRLSGTKSHMPPKLPDIEAAQPQSVQSENGLRGASTDSSRQTVDPQLAVSSQHLNPRLDSSDPRLNDRPQSESDAGTRISTSDPRISSLDPRLNLADPRRTSFDFQRIGSVFRLSDGDPRSNNWNSSLNSDPRYDRYENRREGGSPADPRQNATTQVPTPPSSLASPTLVGPVLGTNFRPPGAPAPVRTNEWNANDDIPPIPPPHQIFQRYRARSGTPNGRSRRSTPVQQEVIDLTLSDEE